MDCYSNNKADKSTKKIQKNKKTTNYKNIQIFHLENNNSSKVESEATMPELVACPVVTPDDLVEGELLYPALLPNTLLWVST